MNIVKRLRKHRGEKTALAQREGEFLPQFGREFSQTVNRLRRFFDEPWTIASELAPWPAIDVDEDEKSLTLHIDVPGFDAKDIEIDVSGSYLTVRGSRKEEKKGGNGGIWRHERHEGSFVRTVTLPSYVDSAKIEARCDKGVLTLTAAKVPGAGPRRIAVKSD